MHYVVSSVYRHCSNMHTDTQDWFDDEIIIAASLLLVFL